MVEGNFESGSFQVMFSALVLCNFQERGFNKRARDGAEMVHVGKRDLHNHRSKIERNKPYASVQNPQEREDSTIARNSAVDNCACHIKESTDHEKSLRTIKRVYGP